MKNIDTGDLSTDEDEEEKKFRLESIKDKSSEEIAEMKKSKFKKYKVMFNIFQVNFFL